MDTILQAWTANVRTSSLPKRHRWDDFKDPVYQFLASFVQFYWQHRSHWVNHFGKKKDKRLQFDRVTEIRFLTYDKAAFIVYNNLDRVTEFLQLMKASELLSLLQHKLFTSKLWLLATLYYKLIVPYLSLLLHYPSNITFNFILLSYLPRLQYYSLHPSLFFTSSRSLIDIFSLSETRIPALQIIGMPDVFGGYRPLHEPIELPPNTVLADSLRLYYDKLYKHTQHLGKELSSSLTNRYGRVSYLAY